jgi:hypothetical protein
MAGRAVTAGSALEGSAVRSRPCHCNTPGQHSQRPARPVGRWRTPSWRKSATTAWLSPSDTTGGRRTGRSSWTSPAAFGPCWVRVATGEYGQQRSPTVTNGPENPQVAGPPAQAAGIMHTGDSDCGPEGRWGRIARSGVILELQRDRETRRSSTGTRQWVRLGSLVPLQCGAAVR